MALIDKVREHYDALTPYYSLFWGEHIHHGISPVQVVAARSATHGSNLERQCEFFVADTARMPLRESAFNVIWNQAFRTCKMAYILVCGNV